MKIIKPSATIVPASAPLEHIEKAYRLCYKSENCIKEGSAAPFIERMVKIGHLSPLEHFRFIFEVPSWIFASVVEDVPGLISHSGSSSSRRIVSCSARALIEGAASKRASTCSACVFMALAASEKYDCGCLFSSVGPDEIFFASRELEDTKKKYVRVLDQSELAPEELRIHGWFTARFVCDRGVTHEIVRHRMAAYSQESTRYCNYSKDKFGNEITAIQPCFWNQESGNFNDWKHAMEASEAYYLGLLEQGATAQEARSVLPSSLKTELLMTTTFENWKHFFDLRCDAAAHPQMREVANMLREEVHNVIGADL